MCRIQKLSISPSVMDPIQETFFQQPPTAQQMSERSFELFKLGEDSNLFSAVYLLWKVPFRKYAFNTPSPYFIGLVIPSSQFMISRKSNEAHLKYFITRKVDKIFKLSQAKKNVCLRKSGLVKFFFRPPGGENYQLPIFLQIT